MRRRIALIPIAALAALLGCSDDPVSVCTSEGPTWEVSPNPIEIRAGQTIEVQVIEVSCSGQIRERVYPPLTSQSPDIATASGLRQTVTGVRAGTATIVVEGDPAIIGDVEVDVTVLAQ